MQERLTQSRKRMAHHWEQLTLQQEKLTQLREGTQWGEERKIIVNWRPPGFNQTEVTDF
jgi:hypothetical protein